ncbi:MAG TPA: outer membrane lipoprotein-sorting protein [Treponemataceae bacterium]|nr:outer membrane lipoprotein-sorting protein [Treponemataceae bacterium]
MNAHVTLIKGARAALMAIVAAGALHAQALPDGKEILAKVDAYREYAKSGFAFDFTLTEANGSRSVMRVSLDGDNREISLAKYLEPKKYARRVVLTVKNAFFIYDRGMVAPVRITPREMMFGQASAGDITRITFGGMYSVVSVERKDGAIALRLKAIPDKGATYDLIDLRVDGATFKPTLAECKGSSGTAIKTIAYDSYEAVQGKELLTAFRITDCATGKTSEVRLGNFSTATLPHASFTVEAMKYAQ